MSAVEETKEPIEEKKEVIKEADTEDAMKDEKEEEDKPEAAEKVKVEELEEDAPEDNRDRGKTPIVMSAHDSTMDVVVGFGGSFLYGMCAEGFQHLLSGCRATVGVKGGRYLFELQIIETFGLHEAIQVGYSTAKSSLLLHESETSFGFDSHGDYFVGRRRTPRAAMGKWLKGSVMGVLLNLTDEGPTARTISLFKDGKRLSKPMPLPEVVKGMALYPTVTFKNVTLAIEFGGTTGHPQKPLSFSVRMLQDAAADDVVTNPVSAPEKPEVIFPVALPNAGHFDYVDQLLEQHPCEIFELSDRAVLEWATKSGNKGAGKGGGSNDRPVFTFGNDADQPALRNTFKRLAPMTKRSFVVAEVAANLTKAGRAEGLARFKGKTYRCIARVLMGKPPAEWVKAVQAAIVADKHRKRSHAVERKRAAFVKRERQKKIDAAKKRRAESLSAKKSKDAQETKVEEDADEDVEIEETFDPDIEGTEDYVPPVELSEEDKAAVFRRRSLPDVLSKVLANKYADFELPDEAEGFDTVEYVWETKDACKTLLQKYIMDQKLSIPLDNIKPSEWFKDKLKVFEAAKKELKAEVSAAKAAKKKEGEEKDAKEDPLCIDFGTEDWALLSVRYELFLLTISFQKDVDDPDRPAVPLTHLNFYFQKYFGRQFHSADFGCATAEDLVKTLIGDTLKVSEEGYLQCILPEETEPADLVKLVEEARKDRLRRVEAGDEAANLKFPRFTAAQAKGGKGKDGKGGSKGSSKGGGKLHGKSSRQDDGERPRFSTAKGRDKGSAPALRRVSGSSAPLGRAPIGGAGASGAPRRFNAGPATPPARWAPPARRELRPAPPPAQSRHSAPANAPPRTYQGGSSFDRGYKRPAPASYGGGGKGGGGKGGGSGYQGGGGKAPRRW